MEMLIVKLLQRFRPRIGWWLFTLAFVAALCPSVAAGDSELTLPAGLFAYAALLGLPLGLRFGRTKRQESRTKSREPRSAPPHQSSTRRGIHLLAFVVRWLVRALVVAGMGALLIIAAGRALPPLGLVVQDVAAFTGWVTGLLRREVDWAALPTMRTWAYLAASLPRFRQALVAAPGAGEAGAQLMVATGGIATTLLGALILGWALGRRHNVLGWSLPMLAAIAFTAILGGGTGAALVFGLGLLLLLAIASGFQRRRQGWDRSGTDYSEELWMDVLAWGGGLIVMALTVAALLPTSVSNPLTDLIWRDVELPSGMAVLERNIERPKSPPKVDVGLSSLPALQLGQSLEEPPPGEVILRIKLDAPLRPSPWPRYWRARVFNLYTGRGWTTNARIGEFPQITPVAGAVPGSVIQEIEDQRRDRSILVGMPDVFAIDAVVAAERLPDGALAALTQEDQPSRYRIASRPQELAAPPAPEQPPDMRGYLGLPQGYPPRVADLARVIVGRRTAPYEQALALETYLRALPYSYQVQPLPGSGDAVEQFLFDMRQGYCTYYASAMAMMARTLGIPARVAIGYATGAYDQASDAYLVRQSDAHAWPELYIDGRWLPFEPTPIRALPARDLPDTGPPPDVAAAPAEQPAGGYGPLIWATVLAAVALLTWLGLRRARPRRPPTLATAVQRRLERSGARAGVAWPGGATLHEYGALLEPHAGDAADALHEVVELVEHERYGGQPLRGEQEQRLRSAAERVWIRLRRQGRR
jgi:transglutaminase-like putative cysteine protease